MNWVDRKGNFLKYTLNPNCPFPQEANDQIADFVPLAKPTLIEFSVLQDSIRSIAIRSIQFQCKSIHNRIAYNADQIHGYIAWNVRILQFLILFGFDRDNNNF